MIPPIIHGYLHLMLTEYEAHIKADIFILAQVRSQQLGRDNCRNQETRRCNRSEGVTGMVAMD